MPCACGPAGVEEVFSDRRARSELNRYRRSGITDRARRLVETLERTTSLENKSVLEVGAGIGDLSLELLDRNAREALLVDAAPAFVSAARSLAREKGVADRVQIVQGDFTALQDVEPRDVVVLDRVVCCYPEGVALLARAARATRSVLAVSFPEDAWWSRLFVQLVNFGQKLRRKDFRVFVHPPAALLAAIREAGLHPEDAGREGPWKLVVATRR